MVEDILEVASGLLNLEGGEEVALVKVTASHLWILPFINFDQETEVFYTLCNDLKFELLEVSEKLSTSVKADVTANLERLGKLFYRVVLFKLQLSDSCLEEVLSESDPLKIRSFSNLLEKAFNFFIQNHNDFNVFTNFYEILIELLEIYGFKRSIYIEMMLLDFMNVEIPFVKLKEAIDSLNLREVLDISRLEAEDPGIINECLTSKKVISLVYEEFFNKQYSVPPLVIVKDLLRESGAEIFVSGVIISEIVNFFFSTVGKFYDEHKVNSLVLKFESEHHEELSASSLNEKVLELQFLRPQSAVPSPFYEPGFIHKIHPYGFKDSSRLVYDRLVRFGRFSGECCENDFFLHEKFSTFNTLIVCSNSGYFLTDVSVEGYFFRSIAANERLKITEGLIFQLGPEMVIVVTKIDRETDKVKTIIKFRIIKGGGLAGMYLYCTLEPSFPKIDVGRAPGPKGLEILDHNNKISSSHCFLLLEGHDIYLLAIQGKPTYVNLKNLEQLGNRTPSDFYRIDKEENFLINEVRFKFVPRG